VPREAMAGCESKRRSNDVRTCLRQGCSLKLNLHVGAEAE
jgi:hypothetical protein